MVSGVSSVASAGGYDVMLSKLTAQASRAGSSGSGAAVQMAVGTLAKAQDQYEQSVLQLIDSVSTDNTTSSVDLYV